MAYKCLDGLGPSNSAANFVNALIYTITLLASAIRFQYPFLKLLQANVLSPLKRKAFGTA